MIENPKTDDGGPAFPQLDVIACERDGHGDLIEPFTSAAGGMSLRDWFAGQALVGMMQAMRPYSNEFERSARAAYSQADAMIAARNTSGQDYSKPTFDYNARAQSIAYATKSIVTAARIDEVVARAAESDISPCAAIDAKGQADE